MVDIRAYAKQKGVGRAQDDTWVAPRALRDGALITAPFAQALVLEGKVYGVNIGTLTTPIAGHVGIDDDQPEAVVDVPSGTAIIPLSIDLYLEDSAGTDTEVVFLVSRANIGVGTSTAVTTARNLKTDATSATGCSVYRSYTGNGTATSNGYELFRSGYPFADATTDPIKKFSWSYQQAGFAPLLVGTSALVLYWAATTTAPGGFAQITWAEFTDTDIK